MSCSTESKDLSGVIFLDKPIGWTSRRAVNEVIRFFSTTGKKRIKAGHAGTLDPLATGMLPILIGEATRFAGYGLNAEKTYQVTMDLGYQTDTLDNEGEVTARFPEVVIPEQRIDDVLAAFRGRLKQVPPIFSAIRVDGRRAHEMARKGETVVMEERDIEIFDLTLMASDALKLTLLVRCSKGTYIRSLCRDIGAALGMGGCVIDLRRLSTGGWPESMMVTPEVMQEMREACVLPLSQWLRDLPAISLPEGKARRFIQGQRIQLETEGQGEVAVFWKDMVLGTGVLQPGMARMVLHPGRILPTAQQQFIK